MILELNPAQLILPPLRAREGSYRSLHSEIGKALEAGVGGFILFGGTAAAAREIIEWIHHEAGQPLLFGADLERGAGQQFQGLSHLPPPGALAQLDQAAITAAGAITAREAREIGINWVFAPVADLDLLPDNPIVQSRSFGGDSELVAQAVVSWIAGCQAEGVPATVKHFPGHGRTVADSHTALPVVPAPLSILNHDLRPFEAAIRSGVASVMTAHVAYPALDPTGLPATRSGAIIGYLRENLGFDGVVVTDAMMMTGATAGVSEGDAALQIVSAGVDLLLYPQNLQQVIRALQTRMMHPGFVERLHQAARRREQLLAFSQRENRGSGPTRGLAADLAARVVGQSPVRGELPKLRSPLEIVVIDDDLDGDWPVTTASTLVTEQLQQWGIPEGRGGSKVVLVYSEPRAGKGRGGLGQSALEAVSRHQQADLVVLFGHPRLLDGIPGAAPVVVAWHRQPQLQAAVADLIRKSFE